MILLTPYEAFKDLIKSDQLDPSNITVFNLNSSVEGFEPIRILPPDPRIYDPNGAELIKDGILLDFIFSNDNIFFEFYEKYKNEKFNLTINIVVLYFSQTLKTIQYIYD